MSIPSNDYDRLRLIEAAARRLIEEDGLDYGTGWSYDAERAAIADLRSLLTSSQPTPAEPQP